VVDDTETSIGLGGAEGFEAARANTSSEKGPQPMQFLALYLNL